MLKVEGDLKGQSVTDLRHTFLLDRFLLVFLSVGIAARRALVREGCWRGAFGSFLTLGALGLLDWLAADREDGKISESSKGAMHSARNSLLRAIRAARAASYSFTGADEVGESDGCSPSLPETMGPQFSEGLHCLVIRLQTCLPPL